VEPASFLALPPPIRGELVSQWWAALRGAELAEVQAMVDSRGPSPPPPPRGTKRPRPRQRQLGDFFA
jgi:hypothetical protein